TRGAKNIESKEAIIRTEIKKIKAAAKGDKRKEQTMLMELYKEREISPFGSLGTLVIQLIILIGLYQGLSKVVGDPQQLINNSYDFLKNLNFMKELAADITKFDATLFGVVDLSKSALGAGGIYWPAMIIVLGSAVAQYFQSKQLLPDNKDGRSLRTILKEASQGKQAEQGEVNAAVGNFTRFLLPGMIVLFTVNIASALSLYWLTSGLVAYWQQSRVLNQDEAEMEAVADKMVIEGEVVQKPQKPASSTNPRNKKTKKVKKKRR
ncbi:MAG: YidC/Oxa1 family membrane protein insertase, partial [Patescibacteria group bacterium]